jgi:hypothetical protein
MFESLRWDDHCVPGPECAHRSVLEMNVLVWETWNDRVASTVGAVISEVAERADRVWVMGSAYSLLVR